MWSEPEPFCDVCIGHCENRAGSEHTLRFVVLVAISLLRSHSLGHRRQAWIRLRPVWISTFSPGVPGPRSRSRIASRFSDLGHRKWGFVSQ